MINQRIFALGAIVSVGLLSGCGASLDDNSSSTTPASKATLPAGTPASFSEATLKWSDVSEANTTVTADGFSSEATLVFTTSTAPAPEIDTTAEVKIAYDSLGKISGLSVIKDDVNLTWVKVYSDDSSDSSLTVTDGNNAQGMIYDPENGSNWDYQTMATWVQANEGTGIGRIGAMSVGNPTADASIPTAGSATFSGVAEGMYVDNDHKFYRVSSDATLSANFVTQSVTFNTTNSLIQPVDVGDPYTDAGPNLTGTFSYSANNNTLTSSNLYGTSSDWTGGTASAKFYGPDAEEIGGVFSIRGTGKEAYEGAFGAKR
ncbi:transferrin-binding protein-like solute binding protein [Candidatus Njordibacter sp. Uisw_056]|uniref:transferrin-binding protein-like solute binding protein n=1 Tax=Candidatus Njordibacter sp. Uisw_056 TaxID=3230973 RepID=UPI003D46D717